MIAGVVALASPVGHSADEPLAPDEAARTMQVPEGFRVTCFAAEPDVLQPVGFCIDDRGRLWVVEAHGYPKHSSKPGRDRIVIFEDVDGDGRHDRRTVFYDKLNYVSGIEVGFGGVWVMSPPYFFFFPDRDRDDRPDEEPRVVLDGFGNHANAHNMANGFSWGPDGWLYGTHGRTNWSMIGRPGASPSERERFDGGVWRYHPIRDVWEPVVDGTTNPWGIDWNDHGDAFISNCVNPHLYHVIPGAHYEPGRGRKSSQYAFERIPTIADHVHWSGKNIRAAIGSEAEHAAGGGHAHSGMMVYLGDNWPDSYRNTIFMSNIHGRRINHDVPVRRGSGYSAKHAPDVMISKDPWFMGVTIRYGPDGAVFVIDWSDTGECHSTRNTRKHTGRIYKITFGEGRKLPAGFDLARLDAGKLVDLQSHRNDWFVRHARRRLAERHAEGRDLSQARSTLHEKFRSERDVPRRLRALWALHVLDGLDDRFLIAQLDDESEYVRAWATRLLCEEEDVPRDALRRFVELARTDSSSYMRLCVASMLGRLEPEERWEIVEALSAHSGDAEDPSLPLMIWYGAEPLIDTNLERFVALAEVSRIPLVSRHVARRATVVKTAVLERSLDALCGVLDRAGDDVRAAVLAGIERGLSGRRRVAMPKRWPGAFAKLEQSSRPEIVRAAKRLALVFEDPRALAELERIVLSSSSKPGDRRRALRALVSRASPNLAPKLLELTRDRELRQDAIRALAQFDDARTPEAILAVYLSLDDAGKQDATQTLASRASWAASLLDAVEARTVKRSEISAYAARQIVELGDDRLRERIGRVWGELRASGEDKAREIERYKRQLKPKQLARADRQRGRAVFEKACASCHKLFGEGGTVAPDITGAQRSNLDYLLENIVDPDASVAKDFQMSIVTTTRGRVVTGLVVEESDAALTVQTVNEKVVVPREEVARREPSSASLMPEGLLAPFSAREVRDLFRYLQGEKQVPKK